MADALQVVHTAVEGLLKGTSITVAQISEHLYVQNTVNGSEQEEYHEMRLVQMVGIRDYG